MQALIKRFVKGESGFTAYGLAAAVLMLIGVGGWVVATAAPFFASTQIGINPLEMMANAADLPSPHYDYYDTVFSSGDVASLIESPTMQQRRVKKSR
jgi:Flp pilus assembly pilin Flp